MFWKELVVGRGDLLDLPPAKPASAAMHLYLLAIRTFGAVIRIKSLIGQYFSDIDYLSPKFHVTNLSFKESPPLKMEFPIHKSLEKRPKEWILQLSTPWGLSFRIGLGFKTSNRSWIQDLRKNRRPPSKLRSSIGAEVVDQAEVVPVL